MNRSEVALRQGDSSLLSSVEHTRVNSRLSLLSDLGTALVRDEFKNEVNWD